MTTKKLEILENSLIKKQALFSSKLQIHMDTVRASNGQPLNDKRNGRSTLRRWEKQDSALRSINAGIEITKEAIRKEKNKIDDVADLVLPHQIMELLGSKELSQWRRHPRFFFVAGVEMGRIVYMSETQAVGHKYFNDIPTKEQKDKFRIVFNLLATSLRNAKG